MFTQWADILCTLAKSSFDTIGSLTYGQEKATEVGPIASDRTGTLPCIGPFKSAKHYYESWADAYLELIADGQIFYDYSVDAYLMFKYLRESVKSGSWLHGWDYLDHGPFFLKHMDDKGDHILVNENFEITGIIDWTFARIAPAFEAFGPSLISANNTDLFDGNPGLSQLDVILGHEMRRQNASNCYYESDQARRFVFGIGMGLGLNQEEAIRVFQALVSTLDDTNIDWNQWRESHLEKWTGDARLLALRRSTHHRTHQSYGSVVERVERGPVPRWADCSFTNCNQPSVRGRSCQSCSKHLRALHISATYHTCPPAHEASIFKPPSKESPL